MRISDWSSDVCSSDLIHQQRIEADDADIAFDARDFVPHHFDAFVVVEQRRLGDVRRHADDEPVDQLRAAADDVHMAERDRIECSGINPNTHQWSLRSEEHPSELQSLMRISYAVFCLKKKTTKNKTNSTTHTTDRL